MEYQNKSRSSQSGSKQSHDAGTQKNASIENIISSFLLVLGTGMGGTRSMALASMRNDSAP